MTSNRFLRTATALVTLSLLTGCVDRDQADQQLATACAAGVNALLDDGDKLGAVKTATFTFETQEAQQMRHVTLTAGLEGDEDNTSQYDCVFEEDFGLMNTAYAASLYRITAGDKTVGKKDGVIEGDMQDFIKLQDTTGRVLHQK
jgi:hypothetical protein